MLGNPVTGCDGPNFGGAHDILFMSTQVRGARAHFASLTGAARAHTHQLNLFYWHAMVSPNVYFTWNSEGCNTANPPSFSKCMSLYSSAMTGIGVLNQPTSRAASLQTTRARARAQPNAAI